MVEVLTGAETEFGAKEQRRISAERATSRYACRLPRPSLTEADLLCRDQRGQDEQQRRWRWDKGRREEALARGAKREGVGEGQRPLSAPGAFPRLSIQPWFFISWLRF